MNVEIRERSEDQHVDGRQAIGIKIVTGEGAAATASADEAVFELDHLSCYYGSFRAVRDISMSIRKNAITAIIGPSGTGKSTLLRSFNRMNDPVPSARIEGKILYHGIDLYGRPV